MAAVPVAINGVLVDKLGRVIYSGVALYGDMVRTDVGVGGGPILPPEGGKPPDLGARPEHPIYYPPIPTHPIVLPDPPPIDPPTEPPTNPADPQWVWGYVPAMNAWQPVYVPAEGEAGPKA